MIFVYLFVSPSFSLLHPPQVYKGFISYNNGFIMINK